MGIGGSLAGEGGMPAPHARRRIQHELDQPEKEQLSREDKRQPVAPAGDSIFQPPGRLHFPLRRDMSQCTGSLSLIQ